ncbi:MAG: hypothetical protein R2834_08435 [Rhodothermales bacterium]
MHANRLPAFGALVVMLLLSSCRTYGGDGTEQGTYDEISKMAASFEDDLASARNELPVLQRAAQGNPGLQVFVHQFEAQLERHAALVAHQEEVIAGLKVKTGPLGRLTTSYRDLNRTLGAMISEQREMQIGYEDLAMDVRKAVMGDAFQAEMPEEIGRYQIAPPYYEKLRYALERARLQLDTAVTG